jgi:putative phosphoesterase
VRIAILSDIHGNLTALEAVVADLGHTTPDLVIQAGDLATHGHRPAEVVDRVRERGWPGVHGNTDEMLWSPELIDGLVREAPKLAPLYHVLFDELAPAAHERLGEDRIAWLRTLPRVSRHDDLVVVHATVNSLWRAPMPDASDDELAAAYGGLGGRVAVYGHIHRPYVRTLPDGTVVANCGSVGLPFDGDSRASYLLLDGDRAEHRRVSYDVEREARGLVASGLPRAEWLADILRTARYTPPPRGR